MSVVRLFESIVASHVSDMDASAVRQEFAILARVRSWIDAREADLADRLVTLSPDNSVALASIDISINARTTKRETRLLLERAHALHGLPQFADALADGTITAAHVNEVASALRKVGEKASEFTAHEGSLVLSAMRLSHDQFAQQVARLVARLNRSSADDESDRQRRATYLKSWTDADGMIHLRGAFDAERGSVLLGRLQNEMERMFHSGSETTEREVIGASANDHLRAMALLEVVGAGTARSRDEATSGSTSGAAASPQAEIVIVVDLETLQSGIHDASVCRTTHGTTLPVEAVRRLACEARIIPVVLNSESVPIDVGRQNRLATARQRRLLYALYRTCAAPECAVSITYCVPHHIDYWENGGRTDLDNLVPLCSRHHHAAHEGGWELHLEENRTLRVTVPDGRVFSRPLDANVVNA